MVEKDGEKGTWYWDTATNGLRFDKTGSLTYEVLKDPSVTDVHNDGKMVTLQDVKRVAIQLVSTRLLQMMSMKSVELFDRCYKTSTIDQFLWLVLEYFHWHLNYHKIAYDEALDTHGPVGDAARKKLKMTIEKFEATKSNLSAAYITLITGLGMEFSHHLLQGRLKYSRTMTDKYLFEALYEFVVFVAWISFGYQYWDSIHSVIGSLFRTSAYNRDIPISIESKHSFRDQSNEHLSWRVLTDRPPRGKLSRIMSPAMKFIHAPSYDTSSKAKAIPGENNLSMTNVGIIGQPLIKYDCKTLKPLSSDQQDDIETDDSSSLSDFD